ncbi:class I SAM-dependent methyltransferase [Haloarcula salinisoli]|uniref:Class I SAM-dependent methyltransferase n=1 Tax=Haloarcula salinisoli TaxID=2487746 RepID=A0A8J8CAM9_9EURY|nr:class I SAM-dependent methyltransferase [Halomicroarcula salinisoli]MBX0288252.1 class I SAM-dependent methyltransferase [Halomicroarcula salinisoli]MBX0305414.1 class I SAM-dependent methyltransferase [Halomicroarcula salinisoli]
MRIPTPADFRELESWGLLADPMAAVSDYSDERARRREDNERHCRARAEYEANADETFVADSQAYYRDLDRPIDRTKWAYLKRRKAWFHPPVEWGRFAAPGTSRILDAGCGDGDGTQRVADFIAGRWRAAGYDGFPLEIVGADLSASRIENARRHTESPHEKITLRFEQDDVAAGLDYGDDFFDYTLAMGFFEVLDERFDDALSELERLTAHGLYVRDILEDYPGLSARPDLDDALAERGFDVVARHRIFEEPFTESGTEDPLAVWPMNVHQVLFGAVRDPVAHDTRY